jgi:hypothetical protein
MVAAQYDLPHQTISISINQFNQVMSFKTAFTKLTKANAIDVSSNHVAYVQLVMDNCAKVLQAVKTETDATTNVATLTELIESSFPVDLLEIWMKECEALIKQPKKIPTPSTTATGTTGISVYPSTPDSDYEATGPRRPPSYKLPPNPCLWLMGVLVKNGFLFLKMLYLPIQYHIQSRYQSFPRS